MNNTLHTNVSILHPLKTSENQRFYNVFRGYKMEHWENDWNDLKKVKLKDTLRRYKFANIH